MLKKVFLIILALAPMGSLNAQNRWVDSVFNTMSREEKVQQLFILRTEDPEKVSVVSARHPGGVVITGGGPVRHIRLANKFQQASRIPLLMLASAEWGIGQTLDSVPGLPKPFVAASWTSDELRTQWVDEICRQLALLGIQGNLAPHVDDEIFKDDFLRYFSGDAARLSSVADQFIRRSSDQHILTIARHLPREKKNTSVAPQIISGSQVDTVALRPLMQVMRSGVDGIMTDNLHFSIQTEKGVLPVGASPLFITEILRKQLAYNGLLMTDIDRYKLAAGNSRNAELNALLAGHDLLIVPDISSSALRTITRRMKKDKAFEALVNESVKRILTSKYKAGLNRPPLLQEENLARRLTTPNTRLSVQQFAEASPTLLRNNDVLPIRRLDNHAFDVVVIGTPKSTEFVDLVHKYVGANVHAITSPADTAQHSLSPGSTVIAAIYPDGARTGPLMAWLNNLASTHTTIASAFCFPEDVSALTNVQGLLLCYTEGDQIAFVVPQILFGSLPARGGLTMTWTNLPGEAKSSESLDRLAYSVPEAAGMDSRTLERIIPIMEEAIAAGATPGSHVLVARHGKVVYEKSAGWLTYEKKTPVTNETIYDLASVTKVSATLQAVTFLYDRKLIELEKKASVYLPELAESNKKDFTLIDILTHQAGLWPFLPFWAQTMKDSLHMPEYYAAAESEEYPFPVSSGLFASRAMKDSLWQWIIRAKIREKPARTPYDYRYSDMGFYILQHLSETLLRQPMHEFLAQNLYEPLGAHTTGYLPLQKFPEMRIAPTEDDKLFRKSLLTGYVHDQGAAMHGGIAGHAGLFSTANDLAKLGQMWLQKGHYGGDRYYHPETVDRFINKQFEGSRRGVGWDKPTQSDWSGPTTLFASPATFGHTGFTGTCIWVDPEFDLVFIFLSNRVHPDMNNNRLLNANIRPRVQEMVYRSIFDFCAVQGETKTH